MAHWSSIESEIDRLARQARASLKAIRDWPVERRELWLELSVLSESVRIARAQPDAVAREVRTMAARPKLFQRFRAELRPLLELVGDLETREMRAARLTRSAHALRDTSDPERIECLLRRVLRKRPRGISAVSVKKIKAVPGLHAGPQPVAPEQELVRWLRSTPDSGGLEARVPPVPAGMADVTRGQTPGLRRTPDGSR
ncbi:hypothetical protein AB0O76_34160 [Streptomyces sp. NPDC086554]|uniref:hypothetical protein n=1 Tax=Streptomyces sp. NPDC086554 TaxID=3154864 RepID=UPI00341B15DC